MQYLPLTNTECDCCGDNPAVVSDLSIKDSYCEHCAVSSRCPECLGECEPTAFWLDVECDNCTDAEAAIAARLESADAVERLADELADLLRGAGYCIAVEHSRLSCSTYISVSESEESDDYIKIRVSDHALPPSYGVLNGHADIELGDYAEADLTQCQSAFAAVENIFSK